MAPTVIVGEDENAGDVARELLDHADNQRQVKVRTDLPSAAFEVPDDVYAKYVGRRKRPDDERRVNQVAEQVRAAGAEDEIEQGDELPDSAKVVEPGDGDDLTRIEDGDELPREATNVEPPSNGEAPNDGSGLDQDDEPEPAPKPRKRAASTRSRTSKSRAGASGAAE
jgi:hypothetical protein